MTTLPGPICFKCRHYIREDDLRKPMHCTAFPERIPQAILTSEADHRKPFDGDHGIQFESNTAHGDAYAAMLFDNRRPAQHAEATSSEA